ncbi:hypothetical protein DYB28_011564, partial [Aphanomyces astaci]
MVTARAALLGLALLSAHTNADECTNLIDHVDYKGHDVGSTAQPDAADCCGDCSDHDSCKVWVWTNYHGGTCWFKSQGTEVTAYYGAKSGALPTPTLSPRYSELADNVDYYGNDISTTKQKFAESCGEDCDNTDGCQLFVWTSHEGGTCWLKHSHSGQTDVYGVKSAYRRFLAIHNDMVSNKEAHNSCVFWFWHRKYMLAFEDMLRDLGPSFACVTLTYFDWVEDYANFKAKKCSNFGTCSPILKDFGGAVHTNRSTPASSDLLIFDHSYPDLVCADASPNNHFCPVVEPGARCDHCLPRNATSWTEGLLSEEWDVDILKGYLQLAEPTPSIKQVSADIELGAHGMLHALLGGVMGNPYSSPADSIFYAHHTAVDMLHAIYHHCKVEPLGLAENGKKSFIQSFEGCTTGNNETITATSRVQSKVTVEGVQIDAEDDKLVGKYFKDLPSQYWELTDTRDFGARAYSYQFNGLLARLYTNCGAAEPVPGARSAHEIEHVLRSIDSPADQNQVDFNKEALAQGASQGLTPTQVETELKKMALLVKAFCLPGSVVPYSDEFKAVWKIRGNVLVLR